MSYGIFICYLRDDGVYVYTFSSKQRNKQTKINEILQQVQPKKFEASQRTWDPYLYS